MGTMNVKRSQAILRMPIDMVDAVMILHDGVRSEVMLFIPPSEDISQLITEGNEFIPVVMRGVEHLVARTAIACCGVPPARAPKLDEDLAALVQAVKVTLRSGAVVEGELRWIAPPGHQRTTDCLNSNASYLVVYTPETSYIVVKAHIAMVTET
jgi:hypothetical protein